MTRLERKAKRILNNEKLMNIIYDALAEACPCFDSCGEAYLENYEPTPNEGYQ